MKCDGEASAKALREAVAKATGGRVVPEEPAKGESQSNGAVEVGVRIVREFVRVFKQQMDDNLGQKTATDSPILKWLIRWAAMVTSRYLAGVDGKTPYERRRGRRCNIPVAAYGETVRYKVIGG